MSYRPDLPGAAMQSLLFELKRRVGLLERYAASARFIEFDPVLDATTTPPTLGTGGVAWGEYTAIGPLTYVTVDIRFGSAGVAAGSGTYRFPLPRPAITDATNFRMLAGTWRGSQQQAVGGTTLSTTDLILSSGLASFAARYPATWPTGTETAVTNAAPWAWAANHRITYAVVYEAAE